MVNNADAVIERRRLRRKLSFWRISVLLLLAAIIVGFAFYTTSGSLTRSSPHIAKVEISGTIYNNEELLTRLEKIAESDAVQGVILSVSSPGGTTVGGEVIFDAVRKIADKKPVVAQVGTLAASAGYMIAIAADHVIAHQSSIVGSIGVLFQYPDVTELLNKLGIKIEAIKSSPLKAEPNFFSPASEEAKAMINNMIMDSYDWFVGLVKQRRPLTDTELKNLSNGAIFTGRQALANKLIDQLGGEEDAVKWLQQNGVSKDLKVIEWKAETPVVNQLISAETMKILAYYLGLNDQGAMIFQETIGKRIFLDGLLSVWHGEDGSASGSH